MAVLAEPEANLRDWTPVVVLGGLAMLALVLVVGVLIGRDSGSSPRQAAPAQVITLAGGGTTAPTSTSPAGTTTGGAANGVTPTTSSPTSSASAPATPASASIGETWPTSLGGYTAQLQLLASFTATSKSVAAAEAAARRKGAGQVGVLNAAMHGLGSGYVVYSGIYLTRAQASVVLSGLQKSFRGAKVVYVRRSTSGPVTQARPKALR